MRLISLFYDLLLILLFALLSYWVAQQLLRPLPIEIPPQTSIPSTPPTQIEPLPFPWPFEPSRPKLRPKPPEHIAKLVSSVYEQTKVTRSYDPAYIKLAYPNGDVDLPEEMGVALT